MRDNRYRLSNKEIKLIMDSRAALEEEESRVLVIGDLHLPFGRKNYLAFCKEQYIKWNCNKVVFIGDIIDSHYSSFHQTDPDGLGGGDELALCVEQVKDWYEAFPDAYVTIGNHDAIIMRKAFDSGVPKIWIKEFNDVLNTPNWKWVTEVYIDDVRYVHTHKTGKARASAKRDMVSTVGGHFHTEHYVEWFYGVKSAVFALSVGCGINDKEYAFAYAAGGKKNAIGCGVVLDGGRTPIPIRMPLEEYKETKTK
jgi:metallophosphoesterase superfamily enzyme